MSCNLKVFKVALWCTFWNFKEYLHLLHDLLIIYRIFTLIRHARLYNLSQKYSFWTLGGSKNVLFCPINLPSGLRVPFDVHTYVFYVFVMFCHDKSDIFCCLLRQKIYDKIRSSRRNSLFDNSNLHHRYLSWNMVPICRNHTKNCSIDQKSTFD